MLNAFYGDLLPAEGHFALWTKTNKEHHWYDNQADLIEATNVYAQLKTQGVYFATAAFNEQAAINGNKDARKQANVIGKKCFYLDLDAGEKKLAKHGPEKVYATQRDAIAAVLEFVKVTGLTPTYFVSSGEGVHLYWALLEEVDHDEWTFTAKKFSALAKQYGLKEDSSVTADSARILRPIGTVHENGSEVRLLGRKGRSYNNAAEFRTLVTNLLDGDAGVDFDSAPKPKKSGPTGINADVIVEGPPKSILKIVPQCGAMEDAVRVKGNVEEPYWRAMLGIIKHTVEGDKAAHIFSSGHPDYDRRDTQNKLDNWKTGPATCAEFSKYSNRCKSCQHNGKIKSPITLGYMTDKEVEKLPEDVKPAPPAPPAPSGKVWDDCIPEGFSVVSTEAADTLYYRMPVEQEDENGDTVTIYVKVPFTTDIFWFGQWSDAEDSADTAQVFIHKWTGNKIVEYTLDQTLLANQQKFREYLASKSIIVGSHPKANKAMEEYAKAQIAMIKASQSQPKIGKRFGMYVTDEGTLACAQGNHVISHDGTIRKAILSSSLRPIGPQFSMPLPHRDDQIWSGDVWEDHILPRARRHVEFLRKHYRREGLEKFQLAAMMALASPLMAFVTGEYLSGGDLPPTGLSVSLFSQEGGRGKTTLMRAAMLAYGKPTALVSDRNVTGSTELGRVARMTLMGTLPVGMDEMGDTSAALTARLISAVANGASREGATKDGGLRLGTPWALVCLMATNKSQRDMITAASGESNAIQYRLLELDVDNITEFDVEERKVFDAEWSQIADCAGALGAVIHWRICRLGVSNVNRLVQGAVSRASERTEAGQTERFQYRGLGAVMALHLLLREIGLEIFDLDTIVEEFKKAQQNGVSYATENSLPTDGLSLLSMALHDMTAFTAVTQNETRRTRHVTSYDEPLVAMPHVVHCRHVVSTRTSYVSAAALRNWCAEHKVSFSKVIAAAKTEGVIGTVYASREAGKAQAFNLLKGMRGSTESMVSCYAFDIARLRLLTGKDPLDGLVDDPTSNVVQITRTEPEPPTTSGDQEASGT